VTVSQVAAEPEDVVMTSVSRTDDAPAPEVVEETATFPAGPQGPVVTATAESEAAVEAALGGSGSLGGDTAAPKKRGLRVRRAAKRPAGPPTPTG
jgi:hypothetical protein